MSIGILTGSVDVGGFVWTGNFTTLDLIAASTNALNGALLVRRPDHFKNFTVVGVILMAVLGGIGGGVTRDVLLNDVPSALTNPAYLVLCVLFGIIGYRLAYAKGQLFREGLFQFMTSFSLVLYAVVGAQKAEAAGLPIVGVLLIAIIGPTAGRWYIDVSSGVTPKQFIRGEWFVTIAALTGAIWLALYALGLNTNVSALIAIVIGYVVRMTALYRAWEEPLAKEPSGAYLHSDGRPMLGRKLQGKSKREMHDLGLLVEDDPPEAKSAVA
jgi:uncharacterized membrane protein YeiH